MTRALHLTKTSVNFITDPPTFSELLELIKRGVSIVDYVHSWWKRDCEKEVGSCKLVFLSLPFTHLPRFLFSQRHEITKQLRSGQHRMSADVRNLKMQRKTFLVSRSLRNKNKKYIYVGYTEKFIPL